MGFDFYNVCLSFNFTIFYQQILKHVSKVGKIFYNGINELLYFGINILVFCPLSTSF